MKLESVTQKAILKIKHCNTVQSKERYISLIHADE